MSQPSYFGWLAFATKDGLNQQTSEYRPWIVLDEMYLTTVVRAFATWMWWPSVASQPIEHIRSSDLTWVHAGCYGGSVGRRSLVDRVGAQWLGIELTT